MVGTTTPVVYGRRWKLIISIYALAQICGALTTAVGAWLLGCVFQGLGRWEPSIVMGTLVLLCVIGAVHDSKLLRIKLPSSDWQVPARWKLYPRTLMAAMFGYGIGTGVLTRIPFATFHVVIAAIIAYPDIGFALAAMLVYGAARAVPVAIASQLQMRQPDVRQRPKAIYRFEPLVAYMNALSLAYVAGVLACIFAQSILL